MTNSNATNIQISTRNSLLLAGRLVIVKLIEALGGVFAPDVPEGEQAECKSGKGAPLAADDRDTVIVDGNDKKSAGNGDCVGGFEDNLGEEGFQ